MNLEAGLKLAAKDILLPNFFWLSIEPLSVSITVKPVIIITIMGSLPLS